MCSEDQSEDCPYWFVRPSAIPMERIYPLREVRRLGLRLGRPAGWDMHGLNQILSVLNKQCFFICTAMCLQTVVSSILIESEIFFFSTMLLEKQNLFFRRINSFLCQSLPPTHPAYAHSNLAWHSERKNKHRLQSRHQPMLYNSDYTSSVPEFA